MSLTSQISRWLKYRRQSITKYRVHSPFLFDLITRVIENREPGQWKEAEQIRKQWSGRTDSIVRHDLGAAVNKQPTPVSVGYLVRHHAVKKKYGRLLYRLAATVGKGRILELGTSTGISTSYLACAAPESEIYSVEACAATQGIAAQHPHLQSPRIHLICSSFNEAIVKFREEGLTFDLIFIDGDHRKESTLRYVEQLLELTYNHTVMIVDDIHWSEDMEEAWSLIKARPEVTLSLDMFQFGVLYFKKELSKQDIILRF